MLELNKIYCCDVLEGLRRLDSESVDLIITSPPYNKCGLNGKAKGLKWVATIDYGGDVDVDNMPEDEYQKWQIEVLNECYRVLKKDGSMFYNHKNRLVKGEGRIISPYEWLYKTDFKIRQEITWDRGSGMNVHPSHYIPASEKIFWLTKAERPRFNRQKDTLFSGDVWRFDAKKNTKHPAPFPIELPDNIIPNIAQGERITVLDCFMCSGTVAASAIKNGCDYIGFELFQNYIDMANERIKEELQ